MHIFSVFSSFNQHPVAIAPESSSLSQEHIWALRQGSKVSLLFFES